jgi:hypothetical protein
VEDRRNRIWEGEKYGKKRRMEEREKGEDLRMRKMGVKRVIERERRKAEREG